MHITKSIGLAAGGLAAIAATPALATTYSLGTLPSNTLVSVSHPLSPTNTSDTLTFGISAFGKVFFNLFGRPLNKMVQFYHGPVGSGTPVSIGGTANHPSFFVNTGNYYAVVSATPLRNVAYNLRLRFEPAPAPGPAGFLVFGAGAAVMAVRKRRAKAKAAA